MIRIGCPVCSCPHWRGSVYRPKSPRAAWLKEYSQVFSTVEGNSTFYAIPETDTFKRWANETADGFKFVLKFPRIISHEKKLLNAELETDQFLSGLDILQDADKLGPSFIQLAPSFDPSGIKSLEYYLSQLPAQFPYAVEVRHKEFFSEPVESELNEMLREHSVDRVIFDSRPLFSQAASDEIEAASQKRKPRSPIFRTVTGTRPIVRLVGRNNLDLVHPWIQEWTLQCQQWMDAGLEPYVFTHAPDDRYAPEFAWMFASALNQPISKRESSTHIRSVQKTLF